MKRCSLSALRALPALCLLLVLSVWTGPAARAELVGFYSFDNPADPFHDDIGKGADHYSADADPEYQEAGGFTGGA